MPKTTFTPEELKDYFKGDIDNYHHFYKATVDKAKKFKIHSDGEYPSELIDARRPNEPIEVKDYRKTIYVPKTKPTFSKVLSSLSKIRRSSDWSIKYEGLDLFTKIAEGESLSDYCEINFPYFQSVTNWAFSILLRKYAIDPNSLVLVVPLETIIEETNFLQPTIMIFESENVIQFVDDDYAVLVNPLGAYYRTRSGKLEKGKSFYIVTTLNILRFDQINAKGEITLAANFVHGLPELPAFKIGAIICDTEGNLYLHESRIEGILPELDEAVREYSDLQAAKVLHVYPERWEYTSQECTVCKGTGIRKNPNWFEGCPDTIPNQIDCQTCTGGYVVAGPYSKILVKPAEIGKQQIPTPPLGEVIKDTKIVELMEIGVENHIYKALSAINFEFLAQTPLNQSGVAKEVDKDELNNTVHAIAEDIVRVIDQVYKLIAYYRYSVLYPFDEIDNMLPMIPVPERFDLLSSQHLESELENGRKNLVNPVIMNALEIEYANKKFNNDPEVRERLQLILELDPLPNILEDNKMSMLSNKGITLETYIISSNIHEFVQVAIDQDATFPDKELKEQKVIIQKMARAQIAAEDAAKQIVAQVTQDTGLDPQGNPILPSPVNGQQPEPVING